MYRVEDKYQLNNLQMYILEHRISSILNPDFHSGTTGYEISSIYFDDMYDTHYEDTIDGIDKRDKYRIRIYNNSFETINLEVKHKLHNRIKKDSCRITYEEYLQLMDSTPLSNSNYGSLDGASQNLAISQFNTAIKTRGLVPKVIVTYHRNAYINEAGNVRITFDRNVRACKNFSLFGQEECYSDSVSLLDDAESAILEVKYDEFLPDYIANTLELGSLWQTSYSKYALCRDTILI